MLWTVPILIVVSFFDYICRAPAWLGTPSDFLYLKVESDSRTRSALMFLACSLAKPLIQIDPKIVSVC
ncbi:MAG: hypothetical protein ACI97A_003279 [Planctomycetota bacterium]|jgi:hypothetical protein